MTVQLAEKVRVLRESRHWTQAQLAAQVSLAAQKKVPAQCIQMIEAGSTRRPRFLPALAKVFAVTVEDLALRSPEQLIRLATALRTSSADERRELEDWRGLLDALPPEEAMHSPQPPAARVGEALRVRDERIIALRQELDELKQRMNTPLLEAFDQAVTREVMAESSASRPAAEGTTSPTAWFWQLGHIAGEALQAQQAGNREAALRHTIRVGALMRQQYARWVTAIDGNALSTPASPPP
jgi:transcriptional regulator with XRE-family HTH domain